MGQKKLLRFEALKGFPNVLQNPPGMQGNWREHFGNTNPITLELACGKGEYTVGLASLCADRNFIGVDIKGNRIYIGAKKCLDAGLHNAAFLRTQIDGIDAYFAAEEVSEIWITFPDPQLRRSRAKKRLTHPKFLRLYQAILKPGGLVHLKTDSPVLYRFTNMVIELYGLELVASIEDVHSGQPISDELKITTHYEALDIAQSNRIHYVSFRLPTQSLEDLDKKLHELVFENEEATG